MRALMSAVKKGINMDQGHTSSVRILSGEGEGGVKLAGRREARAASSTANSYALRKRSTGSLSCVTTAVLLGSLSTTLKSSWEDSRWQEGTSKSMRR